MLDTLFRCSYVQCRDLLIERLAERAPGRIQLLSGPRQVGKTTLLLEVAERSQRHAIYAATDAPDAALPGFWERLQARAEDTAERRGHAVVLLDEIHRLHGWAERLKGLWDRWQREKTPVHIVATGSSALHLAAGSNESLAGRFEKITLTHWSASSIARAFELKPDVAARSVVRFGSYPGAFSLRRNPTRWAAYVRDAILEPAIGRDILALAPVRRPALLRQVFSVATVFPAQIVSLQKLQGQLQDRGALETISHYTELLEQAYLIASIPKYSARALRQRSAPPKLVTLNNALVAIMDPHESPDKTPPPSLLGTWVENACLAHAWNAGQRVSYWREEPFEVDAVIEGSWGAWAIEVKTGRFHARDLNGLLEFVRRHPQFRPLVLCGTEGRVIAARADVAAITWQDFLLGGPPRR